MSLPDIGLILFGIDRETLFARAAYNRRLKLAERNALVELVFDQKARQLKRKDTGELVVPQPVPGDIKDYIPKNLMDVIEAGRPKRANAYFVANLRENGGPITLVQYYRLI